jgi:hypothetical protein
MAGLLPGNLAALLANTAAQPDDTLVRKPSIALWEKAQPLIGPRVENSSAPREKDFGPQGIKHSNGWDRSVPLHLRNAQNRILACVAGMHGFAGKLDDSDERKEQARRNT